MASPASSCILCVDDGKPALTLRKVVLEQNGYRVLIAETCAQALQLFQTNRVNLVLTDHLLATESGLELAAAIKRINPKVPIVLFSGMPPAEMNNVDCFILKSEPIETTLRILHDLLKRASDEA
jgi:CheY-like chemotaxis protein